MLIRTPSKSESKLDAIRQAFGAVCPAKPYDLQAWPVELQGRPGLGINAQPDGRVQTLQYARERRRQMCLKFGADADLDITIESGAADGLDIAVIILYPRTGSEVTVWSEGIPIPPGMLEAARVRGFKTITAGMIIHEQYPHIPADNWHEHFPPYISRRQQISQALERGLRLIGL